MWLSIYYCKSFYFSRSLIMIASSCRTSTPPMDEVVVACPLGRNNNDTRGRAIYVGAITDPGGGTTCACSSSSSKLMVRVSAIRHHLQDAAPSQMLQSGWCRPCSLLSGYRPRHHVLSAQSSSRSFFFSFYLFFFFSWETTTLCIYLLIKMMSEHHSSSWLWPRPPWPRLPWH
jgi:hypothetical protein